MDALALLCTLHADGPTTWRRLREIGCHSLPELARFEPDELAEILGGSAAGARRFLREARHLGERSGAGWLEREEPAASLPPVASVPAPVAAEEPVLPARDQEIVENVLRAWREQDTQDLRPAPTEGPGLFEPAAPAAPEPVARPYAGQHALEPDGLDGLTGIACERLHAEGVDTLEMLVEAELGALALHSGLGYSRLYRWRSLAERKLRSLPSESRLSPAEAPAPAPERDLLQIPARNAELSRRTLRWSPLEEGAAGPFA
jgi:hypothetical protein